MSQSAPENQALAAQPLSRVAALVASFFRSIGVCGTERSLRLCESLSLGEKRFLAVVQCGKERFLVGVTNQSVALLRELEAAPRFGDAERKQTQPDTEGERA